MDMPTAIRTVSEGHSLSAADMHSVMHTIMTGDATPAQIGGFLIGLRMKGETVDEITAAARVMRELSSRVELDQTHLVDTCGTGGDGASTFNISTASAFVVAAAGGRVAKHGNRSISSKSGSADVLEAAGVKLDIAPAQVTRCVDELGVGFMFAPMHHSAMKHAIGPRREMGVRTVFNLLGPLTNPAAAPNQVLGVFARAWVRPMAEVLQNLGSEHVLVVHAEDGMDEFSIGSATQVAELHNGAIDEFVIGPEDVGLTRADTAALAVDGVEQSLAVLRRVLANEPGPALDIVLFNAGAAIYAANLSDSIGTGVERARAVVASGDALAKLDALVALTQSM